MKQKNLRGELLLFITAIIWGISFVAQKLGMNNLGPFSFSAARLTLGATALIPVYFLLRKVAPSSNEKGVLKLGILLGVMIFFGISLQQYGLQYTTAGKSAFITALYIIIVPVVGIFMKKKLNLYNWLGVLLGVVGLYLLSINEGFQMSKGDFVILIGAFFWSAHIILVDQYGAKYDGVLLSMIQFYTAGLLSLAVSLLAEDMTTQGLWLSRGPILFAGIVVVGVAYTLQIFGQRDVPPALASMILSFEAVFAVLAGMFFLQESMTLKETIGCIVMFIAIILSQLKVKNGQAEL